ncbi:MAG: dihydroorotate dehydrogenase-like protein [Bacteroidia bacterium]|nr:dihydroorotate dehydrogenase-like protein [Bacteroidia bacterium]
MNLRTHYLGLELKSPLVVSACTLSEQLDNIKHMEDHGAGAVVLFSLFEEQIRQEEEVYDSFLVDTGAISPESDHYFPKAHDYHVGVDMYLNMLELASRACDIPIIASLNGISNEGWIEYARLMEEAGASALELNIYYLPMNLTDTADEVEFLYLEIIKQVRATVNIPLSIKLSPYFTAFGRMAKRIQDVGANGLVLFNRFYQPDFNIETLAISYDLELSHPNEIRLPLLWISALYSRLKLSLAATTGVQSSQELIKYLLAGADVVMTASALYKHGIPYLQTMLEELKIWMEMRDFGSVYQMQGIMSQAKIADPTAFERASYLRILGGYAGK